jgi:hypothetical protein
MNVFRIISFILIVSITLAFAVDSLAETSVDMQSGLFQGKLMQREGTG